MRAGLPGALALLASLALAGAAHAAEADPLEPIRRMYLAAVERGEAIEPGLASIERLRGELGTRPGSVQDAVLTAYAGALVTLRAKHGAWPPARLRHLRDGLEILDGAVAAHPDQAEIRYLRLMSCYYLPGILGRNWSVREDFAALATLLPAARARYPGELYDAIAGFVVMHGDLPEAERAALRATMGPDG